MPSLAKTHSPAPGCAANEHGRRLFTAMIARCPFVDVIAATTRDAATTPLAALERHEWGDPRADARVWRMWRDRLAPLPHVRRAMLPAPIASSSPSAFSSSAFSSASPPSTPVHSAAPPTLSSVPPSTVSAASASHQAAAPLVASNFYPHALISSSLHDSRVPFSDALKWTAALRDFAASAPTPVYAAPPSASATASSPSHGTTATNSENDADISNQTSAATAVAQANAARSLVLCEIAEAGGGHFGAATYDERVAHTALEYAFLVHTVLNQTALPPPIAHSAKSNENSDGNRAGPAQQRNIKIKSKVL